MVSGQFCRIRVPQASGISQAFDVPTPCTWAARTSWAFSRFFFFSFFVGKISAIDGQIEPKSLDNHTLHHGAHHGDRALDRKSL